MTAEGEPDTVFFDRPGALETWLDEHHAASDGVWVRMAKKSSGIRSLDWKGMVDVLLCFGWIDGQSKSMDDVWFRQRITPRRPRSVWSKINRDKAEALIAAGRMQPAGLAEVERAKADGRWEAAYDPPSTATVPDDLAAALRAGGVEAAFQTLNRTNRYAILHRVMTAKRPETRARRIQKYVDMLAEGERPHP